MRLQHALLSRAQQTLFMVSVLLLAGCGSSASVSSSGSANSSALVGVPSPGSVSGQLGSVVVVQNGRLIKLDPSGQNPVVLTRDFLDEEPSFRPDGQAVIFSRSNPGGSGNASLYRVDLDGSGLTPLLQGFALAALDPEYSRDGKLIAFSAATGPNQHSLYVANADGSGIRRVTDGSESDRHPSFSLDGSQLVFQRGPRIARVNVSGGTVTNLTDGNSVDTFPSYYPPGDAILFTRGGEVWSIQGQTLAPIANTPEVEFQASHSAEHKLILAGCCETQN
jgi:Tol biopolymer transport system component